VVFSCDRVIVSIFNVIMESKSAESPAPVANRTAPEGVWGSRPLLSAMGCYFNWLEYCSPKAKIEVRLLDAPPFYWNHNIKSLLWVAIKSSLTGGKIWKERTQSEIT
jgi:hypothetical protein